MSRQTTTSPRRKPVQKRGTESLEVLLGAAARILENSGLESFSTQRVADEAGMAIGTVYQYFPDKHSILLTLTKRWYEKSENYHNYLENPAHLDAMAEIYRSEPGAGALVKAIRSIPELNDYNTRYITQMVQNLAEYLALIRSPTTKDIAAARMLHAAVDGALLSASKQSVEESKVMIELLKSWLNSFIALWRISAE